MKSDSVFSSSEFLRRAEQVEAAMAQTGLDALIAYSVKNAPGPAGYLGGYESSLGLHDVVFFVIMPGGQPRYALLTNAFWDNPQERTWVDDVLITNDFGTQLVELLSNPIKRIGIAGYTFFPAPIYAALQHALPDVQIQDATQLLMDVAKIKSPAEINVLRQCAIITDAGGRAFLANIHEGATEREIKAQVELAIMLAGSDGQHYGYQLSSGPQAAIGMGQMTGRTLGRGEQVQVDCGALYHGYHGDFSRVTTVGAPSREVQAIMETTADMYEAMLSALRPGVPVADVAHTAIGLAKARGMEPYLYRSPNQAKRLVGHGIGCWYLEVPEVHPEAIGIVEANMVVVLEPILGRPGVGGAKIEDAVLVTPQGAERLSEVPIRTWPT